MNGEVRILVEGLRLERLIVRCLREGAVFCSIRRTSAHQLTFETDAAGAEILSGLCEKFSLPCRIVSRQGRSAMLNRLKKRGTLLAGLLTCTVVMAMLLGRIWLIDVELTGSGSTAVLEEALASLNIRPGMPAGALDPSLLEEELAAASPDYSFIGVRLQGVRLLVEASAAISEPELYRIAENGDLVAERDGVILSVNVLSGEACVQPGDTVIRGQVLIRGTERISKEEKRTTAALGTVIARTWHEGIASADPCIEKTVRTGKSDLSAELRLMRFAWPLRKGTTYASQECKTEILPLVGLFLPLEIIRTTAYETQIHAVKADENILHSALARLAFAAAGTELNRSHPDDCEIADRWIEYTRSADGKIIARAVYETHTNIAVPRDALAQQGG